MSRRRRGGGPPPRRPGRGRAAPAGAAGGRARDTATVLLDGAADQALVTAMSRDGWEVTQRRRRSVQRRGSDVSILYQVTARRGGRERTSTMVVHWSSRRVPSGARAVVVEGLRVHVWRYPSDPFMPGLVRVTSRRRLREYLDDLDVVPGEVAELVRRVYRPTRRGVVEARLVAPGGEDLTIYCKALGDRHPARLAARTRQIAEHHRVLATRVPVPEVLALAADDGIVVLAEVPGKTLRLSILDGDPVPSPAEVAGLALSLGDLEIDSDAEPRRYADPSRHVPVLAGLVPDQAARVRGIVAECVDLDGPEVTVHGDFHDGQVLVQDGAVSGLLDVDGVGRGLLAHDAGRMIAYVESIADIPRADVPTVEAYAQGLQAAFADHVDRETLVRATAAAWIALATGPHRRQQADWAEATRRRIDHAQRWIDQLA